MVSVSDIVCSIIREGGGTSKVFYLSKSVFPNNTMMKTKHDGDTKFPVEYIVSSIQSVYTDTRA